MNYLKLILAILIFSSLSLIAQAEVNESLNNRETYFSSLISNTVKTELAHKISYGGESGGGGNWLESEIAKTSHSLIEMLKINNPHNLNLNDFKKLIKNTEIKISNDISEFILFPDLAPRDAVNFSPKNY